MSTVEPSIASRHLTATLSCLTQSASEVRRARSAGERALCAWLEECHAKAYELWQRGTPVTGINAALLHLAFPYTYLVDLQTTLGIDDYEDILSFGTDLSHSLQRAEERDNLYTLSVRKHVLENHAVTMRVWCDQNDTA